MRCTQCGKPLVKKNAVDLGYGIFNGAKLCYTCCAEHDRQEMSATGHAVMYLVHDKQLDKWEVINWPGSLRFPARVYTHISCRASWRVRNTAYFTGPDGKLWYGRHQGEHNNLIYCRRKLI